MRNMNKKKYTVMHRAGQDWNTSILFIGTTPAKPTLLDKVAEKGINAAWVIVDSACVLRTVLRRFLPKVINS